MPISIWLQLLHSLANPELRFCVDSNPSCNEVCDGNNLQQWSLIEISLLLINHSAKIVDYHQFGPGSSWVWSKVKPWDNEIYIHSTSTRLMKALNRFSLKTLTHFGKKSLRELDITRIFLCHLNKSYHYTFKILKICILCLILLLIPKISYIVKFKSKQLNEEY